MDDAPYGLAWCLAGLAAAAIALLGAGVQSLVLLRGAPHGARRQHVRAALAGPLVAASISLVGALTIDLYDIRTRATLDSAWVLLPLVALGSWFYVNRWLIRALPPRTEPRAPE